MKTKVFTLAVALLIGMATMGQSINKEQTNCKFDVQITKNNEVVVRQTNAIGKAIKIRLYNDDGARVNTQQYTCSGNFKAVYDLTKLNDGNLTFEIVCNNKVIYAETLTKYADGSLSIPRVVPLNQVDQKHANEILFSDK